MQALQSERYHAMDSLRAIMMLLGVVLHAACAYVTVVGDAWPFRDDQTSDLLALMIYYIHIFRMPAFFVMAGFFAALLVDRRGMQSLIINRFKRILLPLVVGWFVLFPLIKAAVVFTLAHESPARLAVVWEYCRPGRMFENTHPAHLWFLYDLLYFYAGALVLVKMSNWLGQEARNRFLRGFRRMVQSPGRLVILGLITAATLYPVRAGILDAPSSFVPDVKTLIAHGVFFAFGWLLHGQADLLPSLSRYAWSQIGLALLLSVVHLVSTDQLARGWSWIWHAIATGCGALIVWLMIFGITGLFIRHLNRPIRSLRYLTDASYWIYLIHLPLIMWLQGLLIDASLSAVTKFSIVLLASVPILVISYHYAVRATFIGQFLNGRRYPIRASAMPAGKRAILVEAGATTQE